MRTRKATERWTVLALSLLLPCGVLARPMAGPEGEGVRLPELHGPARVTRDRQGIAHIQASNLHDVFFLQGWVHAEDRLFQMDVSRRQASGTLAELLGRGVLERDVQLRTFGLRRAAERSLPALSERVREALQAYADGVNAWVATHPLPPGYAELRLSRFAPWTAVDSVAIGKLIAFNLSFELDMGRTATLLAYQRAGRERGFNGTALFSEDVFRSAPFDPAATLPDAVSDLGAAQELADTASLERHWLDERAARLLERYIAKAEVEPLLRQALERGEREEALSNEWVVSGRNTTTRRPLLANDPHLALAMPSTFYPIHLKARTLDVVGSGFAGVPFVIVGHNARIAWGVTTNPLDVTDSYLERVVPDANSPSGWSTLHLGQPEPVLAVPETFRVNEPGEGLDNIVVVPPEQGVPAATLIVPRRNQGPLVELDVEAGMGLSVQYTGFSPTRELEAFLGLDEATHLEEFRDALRFFDVGSQNFAYADVEGHIAYFTSAELPLREDLQAGRVVGLPPVFLRDGTGGNEWLPVRNRQPGQAVPYEILPMEEMPFIINPPVGWFANANNDPLGATLDNDPFNQQRPGGGILYLNGGYSEGLRAGRITQRLREALAGEARISPEEMESIQADGVLLDARFFVPYAVRALELARRSTHPPLRELAEDAAVAEAVGRLARWDFSTPTGMVEGYDAVDVNGVRLEPTPREVEASIAATLYAIWRSRFVVSVLDATLAENGLEGQAPGSGGSLKALRFLLENFEETEGRGVSGVDFFARFEAPTAEERLDLALLSAMRDALALLRGPEFAVAFGGSTNQADYRWGRLHRIVFDSPLGPPFSTPPAGGAFPPPLADLSGIPTDGGLDTVDAAAHPVRAASTDDFMFRGGPAHRMVASLVRGDVRMRYALPGGTSGVFGGPAYVDLLPPWLTNDSFLLPYYPVELLRQTESITLFVPTAVPPG